MNIDDIRLFCESNNIQWTEHVFKMLIKRDISKTDIKQALMNGEIIEQYANDYPYPSCLVLGIAVNNRYLHVVCGIGKDKLWIITAYFPDIIKWHDGFKTRRK